MQRKRGGLVPIGAVSGLNDGPVTAIRDTSPQARHHFTQADQVNQLVAKRTPIRVHGAADGAVFCPAPTPVTGSSKRQNGPHALHERGRWQQTSLWQPAASVAGLGLTEAVRTQSRELFLGASLSEFMRKLDVLSSDSVGTWGIRNMA